MSKVTNKTKIQMGLTPVQIVEELDRYIVGQQLAKKAVALALRNRHRRRMVLEPMRSEIVPKNILMIGSTGVGKTEIARRVAKIDNSPFIKVEATKFTEVGYVGRDVESIIRDLVEIAVTAQKIVAKKEVQVKAKEKANERILKVLVGKTASEETQDKFRTKIIQGAYDNTEIEIDVADIPSATSAGFEIPGMPGAAMGVLNISDIIGKALGNAKTKLKKMTVKEAMKLIITEESDKLIDHDKIIQIALEIVENDGIVFLDEIDKISSSIENRSGGQVSREGVQRDLLPLIEGTNVNTKYGSIATDHILFIASGAFHLSKPSDLLPELQGRLPIRVELHPLTKDDMIKILTEPETSLLKQYTALLATEGLKIEFIPNAIDLLADYATKFNQEIEDIGARRLHTILEKLLEDISFNAAEKKEKIIIDEDFVHKQLAALNKNMNLAKFIL